MKPKEFDQSPDGWRKTAHEGKYLDSAKEILSYIKNYENKQGLNDWMDIMLFHVGQMLAFHGNNRMASKIMIRSKGDPDWKLYVMLTILILNKDGQNFDRLYPLYKDMKGINMNIIERMKENFYGRYEDVY